MEQYRKDFPLLQKESPVIYFDNACATLKPNTVIDAVSAYNSEYPTCGGRSLNHLGDTVTKLVEESRQTVASFIGATKAEEVVFVRNTTEAINLVAHSFPFEAGDVIVVSDKEHNSNLVPWQLVAKDKGLVIKVVPTDDDGFLQLDRYEEILNEGQVRLVAMGHISNLDGVSITVESVVKMAHQVDALVLLDAAQSVPHQKINVQQLGVDIVAFSGHKLCGPSGTGVLYAKESILNDVLTPFVVGGSTVSNTTYETFEMLPAPAKFEAGIQDYSGIFGLQAAIHYLENIGMDTITAHEQSLNKYATEQLLNIEDVKIIGGSAEHRSGILSFYLSGIDIHQTAITLDASAKVLVRSGQHCVHSWFNDRNIFGSVRFSFYFYNTKAEIDTAISALKDIVSVYK